MSVSEWQNGKKKPVQTAREAIAKVFPISPADWDAEAGAVRELEGRAARNVAVPMPPADESNASELARDLLARIQVLREQFESTDLGMSARKALAEMEGKAIERFAKLSGQAATERDILGSPHFQRVLDEMFAALSKHPQALLDLRAALKDDG